LLKSWCKPRNGMRPTVSVLFNESKLLKSFFIIVCERDDPVSVLFNESKLLKLRQVFSRLRHLDQFQYSSTSRNCWNVFVKRVAVIASAFQYSSTSRNCWNTPTGALCPAAM